MLLPALLLAATALAARADVSPGSDVLAEVLRSDLRRNNDDYGESRRLSAHVSDLKSIVPKSKYVRPIQNEYQHSGLQRRSSNNNITAEGEKKPIVKEAEGNVEGQEIRGKGEEVRVYRRETGDLGEKAESEGLTIEQGEKIREQGQPGEEGSSGTPTRATPTPLPAESASSAKKRYEVQTRTPADPQQQYFKNESESIEKFNSLSSVMSTLKRSVATTRKTMKQIVSSVRASGVTVMRVSRDSLEGYAPRRARSRARDVRKVEAEREKRKLRKAREDREKQEKLSRIKNPPAPRQESSERRARARVKPRTHVLHVDPALKQLRMDMRAGVKRPPHKMPPLHLLDMAPARGPRVHARRLRNKLCDRNFLRPEGPKYDSHGKIYAEKFVARGRGNYAFNQTRPPKLVLPRCCNCCRKSVLGCQ